MLFYFFICLIATTLGAISGIGGGVIIKPVMDAVSGMPVGTISFLSGCTVLAMSVVSLLRSRGGDAKVDGKKSTFLALGAAAGGVSGKAVFDLVKQLAANDGLIGTVQSAIMILLTSGVLVYMLCKSRIRTLQISNTALCVVIGLALGMLSSFLGIGGGPINLVVLYFFFSMDTKTAALNSIYIILFSQTASLASTLIQRNVSPFDWPVMLAMVAGGVLGGFVGRSFSSRMNAKQVENVFYVLLVVITGISIYNFSRFAAML